MPNTQILPPVEGEANDAPKLFHNFDNEDFEFSWDGITYKVKSGDIVSLPKYLVNYAAMHIARKIYKRESIKRFNGTKEERQVSIHVRDRSNDRVIAEIDLQKRAVAKNFNEEELNKDEKEVKVLESIDSTNTTDATSSTSTTSSTTTQTTTTETTSITTTQPRPKKIMPELTCDICGKKVMGHLALAGHKRSHKSKEV